MPFSQSKKKGKTKTPLTLLQIERKDNPFWPICILIIGIIVCLTPFINKAFHIDDPLFVWTAKQIQIHPTDFYGFKVNWTGSKLPMYSVNMNPPLNSYFIALAAYFVGWKEAFLHLAFFFPTTAAVLGTYFLARQLCPLPLLATCAGLTAPIFLVSSTNVMCDSLMLAFWVWAVYFWIVGLEKSSARLLVLSAFLIAFGTLTKFVAISLIPLLMAYSLFIRRHIGGWGFYFLIPIIFISGYEWLTYVLYGTGHIYSTVKFTALSPQGGPFPIQYKLLIGFVFMGGCLANILFFSPLLYSRKAMFGVIVLLLIAISWICLLNIGFFQNKDDVSWAQILHGSIFFVIGCSILVFAFRDFLEEKDASSLLLLLWVFGIFIFSVFINWTINGRTILIMVPAVGILLVRRVAKQMEASLEKSYWNIVWPLIPSLILTLVVVWADCQMANSIRYAANNFIKDHQQKARHIWFNGHWGFQYYMESGGAKAVDVHKVTVGDVLIVYFPKTLPVNSKSKMNQRFVLSSKVVRQPAFSWLATMDHRLGAGLYSYIWGPLPFAFGRVPAYPYLIYEFSAP